MSHELEEHIKNWFDYQWNSRMTLNEESVLDELPEKLKAEIAMNVHLNTLKRVAIFQVMLMHTLPHADACQLQCIAFDLEQPCSRTLCCVYGGTAKRLLL